MSELTLTPAAAQTLQRWHAMLAGRDLQSLPELLAPDAVFRSPMAHTPYPGASVVSMILNTVITVFEDFKYHRELATADGLSVVLEFSARVGDKQLAMQRLAQGGAILTAAEMAAFEWMQSATHSRFREVQGLIKDRPMV